MSRRNYAALTAVSAAAFLATAEDAGASGFAIREQSGSLLGQAFAGANAYTMDPSVIFFNPAGMSALDGTRISGGVNFFFVKSEFDDEGSTSTGGPGFLGNEEGGDLGENALVPIFYAMTSFEDFRFGIGVNAPFGLVTNYDENSIGRYAAITSALRVINVNPVVSYQVTDWLSLGAGAQIQRSDARLTSAMNFGLLGDEEVELQADGVGYGFTAGALITPMPGTRIGVGFRSSVSQTLEGDVDVNLPAALGGGKTTLGASTELETPETLGLSIYQQVTDRLSIAGSVEWTNWSRFDELRVDFDTPGIPDDVTRENWNDSFFFALGLNYQVTENLLVRGGVAYDQTPVPDAFRTAALPDEDRYWLSFGGTYQVNEVISIDVGYTHIFADDAVIEEDFAAGPVPVTGTIRGEYDPSIDLFGVQVNIRL
ncbi:MAG TPA: outer membrane protein transport protein [Alphaproteobacteria bacterium]|nr:outer membrane protein transport protein [Alphaproteobacteria bacterium]